MKLPFAPPRLSDAWTVRAVVRASGLYGNDLNFANLFLLSRKHRITIALDGRFLFRRYEGDRRRGYAFPVGVGDLAEAVRLVEEDAQARGEPCAFILMTGKQTETLESIRPGKYRFSAVRGDADYLYARDALASLAGRRFHRKRNAVKRFEHDYPDWRFEPLSESNGACALAAAERWFEQNGRLADPELAAEREAIQTAVRLIAPLELTGGVLFVGGEPFAAAILSATLPDVYDVHFEKAASRHPGGYAAICRETARALPAARRINREEDLNLPGLRESKQSWFPEEILLKFTADPNE